MSSPPTNREAVILDLLVSGEKYGRELNREYANRTGKGMPAGSLYTTLQRMEDKGFIRSRHGEPVPERGGHPRRYFRITGAGHDALHFVQATLLKGVTA